MASIQSTLKKFDFHHLSQNDLLKQHDQLMHMLFTPQRLWNVKRILGFKHLKREDIEEKAFLSAAAVGDQAIAEELIMRVDHTIHYQAFELACKYGQIGILKLLADEVIDPSCNDNYGLRVASRNNQYEIVKYLVQNYDNIDPGANQNEAIFSAIRLGNKDLLDFLTQNGKKAVFPLGQLNDFLDEALIQGNPLIIEDIMMIYASLKLPVPIKPFKWAVENDNFEILRKIQNGLWVDGTLYHYSDLINYCIKEAAKMGKIHLMIELLSHKTHEEVVKMLDDLFVIACERGNKDLFMALPFIPNHTTLSRCLVGATSSGSLELVKLLLLLNADPTYRNFHAVKLAAKMNRQDLFKLILQYLPDHDDAFSIAYSYFPPLDEPEMKETDI